MEDMFFVAREFIRSFSYKDRGRQRAGGVPI